MNNNLRTVIDYVATRPGRRLEIAWHDEHNVTLHLQPNASIQLSESAPFVETTVRLGTVTVPLQPFGGTDPTPMIVILELVLSGLAKLPANATEADLLDAMGALAARPAA